MLIKIKTSTNKTCKNNKTTVKLGHIVQQKFPDGQEIVKRVFFTGLARYTSALELKNFFLAFGKVVDVRIVCDRKTGFNKAFGFVTFTTMQACDDLLKKGTVDYKGRRKLRHQKAVKKEIGGRFFA